MAEEPRRLIQNNLFHGLPNEDPYLATYIEICNTIRLAGVPAEAIKLSLFLFSLAREAKRWLHSIKGNSLKSWDEVVEKFLKKYFPESKTAEGKAAISSFHQFPDESLCEALERFRGLLRKTPTHGFSEPIELNIFIDGLRPQSKQLLDASAGGCTICGGAHASGCCIPHEEQIAHEVNYMGNQPRGNFNTSGFPGFQNNQ
ncbi:uncharacterized protein LOC114378918 [Glycine soja]|uniref:uncharacterized protein LOC114378918 n=1 Tax=Glycine soja TaxID=3848 RepID=UPI00103E14CD|nr:uncharacterized protein LOC114378918 [Glycine soja]